MCSPLTGIKNQIRKSSVASCPLLESNFSSCLTIFSCRLKSASLLSTKKWFPNPSLEANQLSGLLTVEMQATCLCTVVLSTVFLKMEKSSCGFSHSRSEKGCFHFSVFSCVSLWTTKARLQGELLCTPIKQHFCLSTLVSTRQ